MCASQALEGGDSVGRKAAPRTALQKGLHVDEPPHRDNGDMKKIHVV